MGIKRHLLYTGGILLATGIPASIYSGSDIVKSVTQSFSGSSAVSAAKDSSSTEAQVSSPQILATASAQPAYSHSAFQAGTSTGIAYPMPGLEEVLRFDITVEWVMQRWPRVSTGLPYLQLQGYRVPLVTGSNLTDIAGSLTYYFNAQQQLQRITLRGTCGDPTLLVNLLTSRFRFTRRLTNDPSLIVYETVDSKNRPAGSLKIRSAKIIRADQPLTRFEIDLEMDRVED